MPHRIQLSRRKGWRKPEGTVVVARPTRWGNPFSVSRFGRPLAIRLFETPFEGSGARACWPASLRRSPRASNPAGRHGSAVWAVTRIELARAELAGHDLACWCRLDDLCHADVLLRLANA